MTRLFRREVYFVTVAAIAAALSYRAGIDYLPSVFLLVVGILMLGVFAELEDAILLKIEDSTILSHDWHLVLFRAMRTIILLCIGVLVFAAADSRF
jgi:hypothetical protein